MTKKTKHHSRKAPTYRRLEDEAYAALDEAEKRRHNLHLDLDAMLDAIPYARLDRDSIGFKEPRASEMPGRTQSVVCDVCLGADTSCAECGGGGRVPRSLSTDPTGDTALRGITEAVERWLAGARGAEQELRRLGRLARLRYGYDPARGRPEGDRPTPDPVRVSEVELCAFCNDPAPTGRDEKGQSLLRRVDDKPVHASPCYWTLAKQAQRAGVSASAHLHNLMSNVSNPKSAAS